MSLVKLKTVFSVGAWLPKVKTFYDKINEIIDYLNDSGTIPKYFFKQVESGLGADNEYTITEAGTYLVQLELAAAYDNIGEQVGDVYSEVMHNGQVVVNDNDTHTTTVAGVNVKVTHTHNFTISAVEGDTVGFGIYFTRTVLTNGLITLVKVG